MSIPLGVRIIPALGLAVACAFSSVSWAVTVSPSSLNFPGTMVGDSAIQQVTISEITSTTATLVAVGFQFGEHFSVKLEAHYRVNGVLISVEEDPALPLPIYRFSDPESGEIQQQLVVAKVAFRPGSAGWKTDQLLTNFASGPDPVVNLSGTANSPPPVPLVSWPGLLALVGALAGMSLVAMRALPPRAATPRARGRITTLR